VAAVSTAATLIRGAITVSVDPDAGLVVMACTEHGVSRVVQASSAGYGDTVAAFLDRHAECGGHAQGYVAIDDLSAWGGPALRTSSPPAPRG
jgi:hypothetical protein